MSKIELMVLVILALMALPDLLRRWRRSSLLYPAYVVVGLLLGPVLDEGALALAHNLGEFGFIMLLFGIGLEIDFPDRVSMLRAMRIVNPWVLVQAPFALALALLSVPGWPNHPWSVWAGSMVAAVALLSCSIGIAFPAWLSYRVPSAERKADLLNAMILLEVPSIIILTAGSVLLRYGFGLRLALNVVGIVMMIVLIRFLADRAMRGVRMAIERLIRWRVHFVVLFVLSVAALGGRLGLGPPKTAFFLGLGISRSTHEGLALEHHLRKITHGLLIPIFFVSLGSSVPLEMVMSRTAIMGIVSGVFLIGLREGLYRRRLAIEGAPGAHLLLGPNLTIAAVAMNALVTSSGHRPVAVWMMFASLTMTILSLLRLPPEREGIDVKLPEMPGAA